MLQGSTDYDSMGAMEAVTEAMNLLHTAPHPQDHSSEHELYLTPKGCMVVSMLQQIVIRLLTKRLMNLMTTESFILNHLKMPRYLDHYLTGQSHFSLKMVIENYYDALKATSQ